MAKTQLQLKIGADNTEAKKKLNEVKKQGIDAVAEIQQKNKEAMKNALGFFAPIAIAFGALSKVVGKIGEAIGEAFNRGKVFQEFADKAKLSAQTMAMLKAQADDAGVSTDKFNQALDDLAKGKTSVEQLQRAWGGLNGEIGKSSRLTENFKDLARTMNVERLKEASSGFFSKVGSGFVELTGGGGQEHIALAMELASRGVSREEARYKIANQKTFLTSTFNKDWFTEAMQAYDQSAAQKKADELESRNRNIKATATELTGQDLLESDIEKLFEIRTGLKRTYAEIKAIADMVAQENPYQYELDRAKERKKQAEESKKEADKQLEQQKKLEEEKRKAEEEQAKNTKERQVKIARMLRDNGKYLSYEEVEKFFEEFTGIMMSSKDIMTLAYNSMTKEELAREKLDQEKADFEKLQKEQDEKNKKREEMLKIGQSLRDVFTEGGGLLANVNYGHRNESLTQEQVRLSRQQLDKATRQLNELKDIKNTLKGE